MSVFLSLLADQRPTRVTSRGGVETGEMDGVREPEKRGREGDRMLLLMRVRSGKHRRLAVLHTSSLGPARSQLGSPSGSSGFTRPCRGT